VAERLLKVCRASTCAVWEDVPKGCDCVDGDKLPGVVLPTGPSISKVIYTGIVD